MARCSCCNKKIGICGIDCKWCGVHVCISCVFPEKHACVSVSDVKSAKQQLLKESLENGKTTTVQNEHNYVGF